MPTYRVYFQDENGEKQKKDYASIQFLLEEYEQIGIEEDSYTIRLHGEPLLRGLIGPMSDGKTIVKYETPLLFVHETEEATKLRRPTRE